MSNAFIGVGSNLGDRHATIARAIELLCAHPGITYIEESQWREYPALTLDGTPQPDFVNGVVHIETNLAPHDLIAILKSIEERMGRPADHERWQPRTIDMDILLYDDRVCTSPTLTIPHPDIVKRIFVLEPLCDIRPDAMHPVLKKSFSTLLHELS